MRSRSRNGGAGAGRFVTRFVLLSTPRSGTGWLLERLAAHPFIAAYEEMLLAGRSGWPDWPPGADDRPFLATYLSERGLPQSFVSAHRQLSAFLNHLYEPRESVSAIGFKLMYESAVRYPEILHHFRRGNVRVVHLIRANLLDLALSQMGMSVRRRSHAWAPEERESVQVDVNTETLQWWLRKLERDRAVARAILRASRLDVHEVGYEALLADDANFARVLQFLRVPVEGYSHLQAKMLKLAPFSHREGIANFGAVEQCLAGTRFQRFVRP